MKRSPLARSAAPKRHTPLRAVSARRESERDRRRAVVAEVLERDGHRCQAPHDEMAGLDGCYGVLDVHEIIARSAWRDGYLVPANCLTLARSCHRWVDANPLAAHVLGLYGRSWERSA